MIHCPDLQFGQQSAAQLPWFHIVTLLTQIADPDQRAWYAVQAVQQAWSRVILEQQIHARVKAADDRPTIGLLLCKTKKRLVAEYQLVRALPEPLDVSLPSIEEIEAEFLGLNNGEESQ